MTLRFHFNSDIIDTPLHLLFNVKEDKIIIVIMHLQLGENLLPNLLASIVGYTINYGESDVTEDAFSEMTILPLQTGKRFI